MKFFDRRAFLKKMGINTTLGVGATVIAPNSYAQKIFSGKSEDFDIIIMGAGIGGLSTAHELIKTGLKVALIEKRPMVGGKARSVWDGKMKFPGEHGFRVYAGFYHNLLQQMREIPTSNGKKVIDNLVPLNELLLTSDTGRRVLCPLSSIPEAKFKDLPGKSLKNFIDWLKLFRSPLLRNNFGEKHEIEFFLQRLVYFATSCEERRNELFENQTWFEFMQAENASENYKNNLMEFTCTIFQAMKPMEGNANSIGATLLKMGRSVAHVNQTFLYMFDRPTQEAFFDPWKKHLEKNGAKFFMSHEVDVLETHATSIKGVYVKEANSENYKKLTGKKIVNSLPPKVFSNLMKKSRLSSRVVNGVEKLKTDWMSGIQLYFKNYYNTHEIVACVGNPWALTFTSQHDIWRKKPSSYGDNNAETLLSVIISNWDKVGYIGKKAKDCTKEEILEEIFEIIKRHCGEKYVNETKDSLHYVVFDPGLKFENDKIKHFDDPLYVNTPGDWKFRPGILDSKYQNLFYGTAFTKTGMNMECMEGASESGRKVAHAILKSMKKRSHIKFKPYKEFQLLNVFKSLDKNIWWKSKQRKHPLDKDMSYFKNEENSMGLLQKIVSKIEKRS